jgi:cysteine-S-conjugate beta-lyase
MTGSSDTDRFGLRSLDVERLRASRGAKWGSRDARYSAWVADMDFPVAPAVTDALQQVLDGNEFGYPNWGGPFARSPAAKMFAPRMADRFGWQANPDRVHDMIDVIQGVRSSVYHLSSPGDGVVLHMPAYHPFIDTIGEMDRHLIPVTRTDGAFDYDDLEQRLAVASPAATMWILCHPHNPLGHVFDRAELERIAEIAARFDLTVISDEIHADLTMPGETHIPFESLGAEVSARTVTVTSASKAFNLAGLRWAVLHAGSVRMQEALAALPGHYLGAPNVMAVAATVAAWTDGGEWLDAVIGVVDENRRSLTDLLATHLPGVVYEPPRATYLAWLDCRPLDLGDDPADTFAERGVALSPGPQFGPQGLGHARINLATSPGILAATVAAMAG